MMTPAALREPMSQAMSAVAVVVSVIPGIADRPSLKPSGAPPGTQASHASGVPLPAGLAGALGAGEDGVAAAEGCDPMRPAAYTSVTPATATTTNAVAPRIHALRERSSMRRPSVSRASWRPEEVSPRRPGVRGSRRGARRAPPRAPARAGRDAAPHDPGGRARRRPQTGSAGSPAAR